MYVGDGFTVPREAKRLPYILFLKKTPGRGKFLIP